MTSTIGAPASTSAARHLVCRSCGAQYPLAAQHACYECFGPLEVGYDPDALRRVTREQIEAGPKNIWRYAGLLPVGQDPAARVTLNPGLTPLIRADALAADLGITGGLWVKDDSANPTHSFKDRVVSVALTAAKGLGFSRFACASTGNLANSVAAHSARAGVPSIVFIPSDLEPGKLLRRVVGDVFRQRGGGRRDDRAGVPLAQAAQRQRAAQHLVAGHCGQAQRMRPGPPVLLGTGLAYLDRIFPGTQAVGAAA
jgi:threonine synthase